MKKARALPRSIQISEALIREISAGILSDGARLPTERQMAQDYDVAVGTLRKALAILEKKGMLERIQGSGNYIRSKYKVDSVYTLFRLELLSGGGLPTAQILSMQMTFRPKELPFRPDHTSVTKIIRLRYLNDVLIALEEIWLDRKLTQDLQQNEVSESLYEYYKNTLNLIISRMEDKIGFQPIPSWVPEAFNMCEGEMAGYIERIGWDQFDQPAEFSKTWFNPAVCHYVNRS